MTIVHSLKLSAGDWVEVRSKSEILGTLDKTGKLDGLPFMPQMFQYCGQRLRVSKRAHKLCDTVNGTGGRKMENAVHLEGLRCDGQAYGDCEMMCLLFWKEAWLKPSSLESSDIHSKKGAFNHGNTAPDGCNEEAIWANTRVPPEKSSFAETIYSCQATALPLATEKLPLWNLNQYVEDVSSGNARASQVAFSLFFYVYSNIAEAGIGFGWLMRRLYDSTQRWHGAGSYPARPGILPSGAKTPNAKLNLQPGELVRIKPHEELLKTMDEDLRNRGMTFHQEMVPYCGKTFRVLRRIGKILNEKTGQMMHLKNECVVLEGADCLGRFTNPLACPRACYPYWREIWLERVDAPGSTLPASSLNSDKCVATS